MKKTLNAIKTSVVNTVNRYPRTTAILAVTATSAATAYMTVKGMQNGIIDKVATTMNVVG